MRNQAASPIEHLTAIASALADPSRVRLLAACLDGERCVCQLLPLMPLSGASVSKHLAQLRDAGLLSSRREGRWVHYRLPESPSAAASDAIAMVRKHAAGDARTRQDQRTLANVDTIDPRELARMQREGCCPDLTCCGTTSTPNTPTTVSQGD